MTNKTAVTFRALLGASVFLCALAPLARAAGTGGPLMTYQGRLKESGSPVSGVKSIDISICSCLSGACCSSSGSQPVSVSSGLFRTTFTVPSSVDLSTGPWYLEVFVAGAGALAPREQLTYSPYAVYASSAGGLVASPGSAGVTISTSLFIVNGSSVGIGTANPTGRLQVSGGPTVLEGDLIISTGNANGGVHLSATQITAPSIGGFGNCGSAPAPTFTMGPATDMHGSFTIQIGGITGPLTAGCGASINFRRTYATTPKAVLLTPASSGAGDSVANGKLYVSVLNTTGFSVTTSVAPTAGSTLIWYYVVIE